MNDTIVMAKNLTPSPDLSIYLEDYMSQIVGNYGFAKGQKKIRESDEKAPKEKGTEKDTNIKRKSSGTSVEKP